MRSIYIDRPIDRQRERERAMFTPFPLRRYAGPVLGVKTAEADKQYIHIHLSIYLSILRQGFSRDVYIYLRRFPYVGTPGLCWASKRPRPTNATSALSSSRKHGLNLL